MLGILNSKRMVNAISLMVNTINLKFVIFAILKIKAGKSY